MAGAARIGALHAMLGLDSAEFTAGLAKANAGLGKFAKAAKVGFALAATAAAVAGAAIGVAIKGAIDRADQMDELAQKVGVSVEALTSLGYAAKMSGTDTETLSTGLRKLSQNMLTVAQGSTGPVALAFKALGIGIKDANGALRSSDEVLIDVADKFSRMEDGVTKTALAVQLFGKSGAELIPFLNQGRSGIGALTDEADRLGITISGKTAAAAGDFNDSLDRLQAAFDGVINKIMAAVLPALNEFGDTLASPSFAENAAQIATAIVEAMNTIVNAVNTAVSAFNSLREKMEWANSHDMFGNPKDMGSGAPKTILPGFVNRDQALQGLKDGTGDWNKSEGGKDLYAGIFGASASEIAAQSTQVAASFVPVIENTKAAAAAASSLKAVMAEGRSVFEATRTPAEAYGLEIERLNALLQKGAIDQDTYNRAVVQAQDSFKKAEASGNQLASTLASGLANVFSSVVDGSKSAVDAIADLLKSLGNMLIHQGFQALIGGMFGGGGGMGSMLGGLFGGGGGLKVGFNGIPGYEGGGYTGSGGRTGGIDGRGGFMAMLHPDETVIDHSKGRGAGATISISISGSRQDAAEIAREVRRVLPDAMKAHNQNPYRRPS